LKLIRFSTDADAVDAACHVIFAISGDARRGSRPNPIAQNLAESLNKRLVVGIER
jgi:hypothetical protein